MTLEAFKGPLELLLHLIDRNKLDITDIPIALVTNQYLEYLELLHALDVVVAGEYLVMAATLLQIKSRMLLPKPDPPEEEDPRLEIVKPLQELARLKSVADRLEEMPWLHRDVFFREPADEFDISGWEHSAVSTLEDALDEDDEVTLMHPPIEAGILDLINALQNVLGNSALPRSLEITRARATLSQRMEAIEELLQREGRTTLAELMNSDMDRYFIIVTFLALLELAKLSVIRMFQEKPGDDIIVVARSRAVQPDNDVPLDAA